MKNVLFLAPGYQYAQTVIKNLSSELDRKKIPYNASKFAPNIFIRTDKVNVEIAYMDPVRWTHELFMERDAVFGKKELVEKARKTFMRMHIHVYDMSLSRYISEAHMDVCYEDVKTPASYLPEITKVHFNPPMTIVLWNDGTKTMVKCQEGDIYTEEVGLSLCITKKALGNMPNFNNIFRKWIPEKVEDLSDADKFAYQSYVYSACNNPAQAIGEKLHKLVENFLKEKPND